MEKQVSNSETNLKSFESNLPIQEEPSSPNKNTETKQVKTELSLEDKIELLEEKVFILSGDGSGYEGAAHLAESARLKFELTPIPGTDLEEFKIQTGILRIGGLSFGIDGGLLILKEDVVSLTVEHNNHGSLS